MSEPAYISVTKLINHHFPHKSPTSKQEELLRTYLWTFLDIMQKHGMTTRQLVGRLQDMDNDVEIFWGDLTQEGRVFDNHYFPEWLFFRRLDLEEGTPDDFARASRRDRFEHLARMFNFRSKIAAERDIDLIKIEDVRQYACENNVICDHEGWPRRYHQEQFFNAVAFMQEKGLTSRTLVETLEDVDYDFEIWTTDLTDDVSREVLRVLYNDWFRRAPEEESEEALAIARDRGKLEALYQKALKNLEEKAAHDAKRAKEKQLPPFDIPKRPPSKIKPKEDWAKYDDARWHDEANELPDNPDDWEDKSAARLIGFYLCWALITGLASEEFIEDWQEQIERLRTREIMPGEFLSIIDFILFSEQLNDEGNAFSQHYYKLHYYKDFEQSVASDLKSIYHVEDSWNNFMKVKELLDQRLSEWEAEAGKG